MIITQADVTAYRNRCGCSLKEAYHILIRKELRMELLVAKTVEDLKVVLIGLLDLLDER